MKHTEFAKYYPDEFSRALMGVDPARLAELVDRCVLQDIGLYFWHIFDTAKHELEEAMNDPPEPVQLEIVPMMLKRQCD